MYDDINDYIPSIINPRTTKKQFGDTSLTQNSTLSRCSLSLKKKDGHLPKTKPLNKSYPPAKENSPYILNMVHHLPSIKQCINKTVPLKVYSQGCSDIKDLETIFNNSTASTLCLDIVKNQLGNELSNNSQISLSSCSEFHDSNLIEKIGKTTVSISFGIKNCDTVNVSTKNGALKNVLVTHTNNNINVDCEVIDESQSSIESDNDENMDEMSNKINPLKRCGAVDVNLEIKKQKLTEDNIEKSKVLILNSNAIEKISHVIVQPPNYTFVKRNIFKSSSNRRKPLLKSFVSNEILVGDKLKQQSIDNYFRKKNNILAKHACKIKPIDPVEDQIKDVVEDMNKKSGVCDTLKCDKLGKPTFKVDQKESNDSHKLARLSSRKKESNSAKLRDLKASSLDLQGFSPRIRNSSATSHSPRKNTESIQFSLPLKSKSIKTTLSPRNIPHHKIVAGTHFAVDAFSYGEIPNVKHYFLTHFHSDHYAGLKKSFNKLLFCSKITATLCTSRLGVNPRCIHLINIDEPIQVEGVEVLAVEANHCPGAIMLVFTLPNGKTLLHTGDFRATPVMESYPVFWNKDVHTIYLDTTYCNPRYDFPTQDQSLDMALYILRQKKQSLEKANKSFASVLIVCGTYIIGKEKFFLGVARRIGCSVWACPEKDRVLRTVEGRSFSHAPPQSCQLHVVPMKDLTHEKLKTYLDSFQGAFSEVVAFKPSGWENGKNSSIEKDTVTIHGIPYSEHSSFSEMIRFVKFLGPKQVVPTVDISGGVKAVQKYFSCPLVYKEESQCQAKVTDYFSIHNRHQVPAVT